MPAPSAPVLPRELQNAAAANTRATGARLGRALSHAPDGTPFLGWAPGGVELLVGGGASGPVCIAGGPDGPAVHLDAHGRRWIWCGNRWAPHP